MIHKYTVHKQIAFHSWIKVQANDSVQNSYFGELGCCFIALDIITISFSS